MDTKRSLLLVVLSELMNSDDRKRIRGKARPWIKRRTVSGCFNNVIPKLMIEDRMGFKEMFHMSVEDFEFILR